MCLWFTKNKHSNKQQNINNLNKTFKWKKGFMKDIEMVNKQMKRYSTSSVIRKVLNTTMILNHFTPTTNLSEEVEDPNLIHCWCDCKWGNLSVKVMAVYNEVWHTFPYNLNSKITCFFPKRNKNICTCKICPRTFITVLFIMAKNWK